ncbi:MAG: hypothetical protein EOM11_00200 [Erysipelotrichia bacterium]|nr:hypothetical protein [Erysipelotrichia bacterium]
MEEKDVIDVEVVEEEVEVLEDGNTEKPVEEEKATYSDSEIDEKVSFLKDCLKDNNYEASDMSNRIAKEIANNSKEYLDNDTFLWVMYAYALKYAKEENKNAERYCYIRMKNILDAEEGKDRKPRALTFVNNSLNEKIKEEVALNTAFMNDVIKGIRKQFLVMEVIMLIIFAFVIKVLLSYTILMTIFFTFVVGAFNYAFTFKNLKKKYYVNQTNTSKSYCQDEELIEFDRPVAFS